MADKFPLGIDQKAKSVCRSSMCIGHEWKQNLSRVWRIFLTTLYKHKFCAIIYLILVLKLKECKQLKSVLLFASMSVNFTYSVVLSVTGEGSVLH